MSAAGSRIRCVHLLPDTDDAGAESQARFLLEGLSAEPELDLELAYFGAGRAHSRFEATGLPMRRIPRRRRLALDLPRRSRRLRRAYAGHEPDLLHTWLLEGNIVGLLAARHWRSSKVVITQSGSWNELDYRLPARLQRLLLGRADHAISNSPGGREVLIGMGMDPGRISVIPNGIPGVRTEPTRDRATVLAQHGWEGRRIVAWAGRAGDPDTVRQKDFATLLAGVAAARETGPRILLALVGPTADQFAAAGIDLPPWAVPLGWTESPADYLAAADVVALSSRMEGISNVVCEALLLGAPVVSTDCGGHCDAVRAAGGRVVPVADPAAFGAAIVELVADPPPPDRVRRVAADEFSFERLVASTAGIYRELIAGRR